MSPVVHFVSRSKDQYSYRQWVNPWGFFDEAQTGVHVPKAGSKEGFFAILFPRAAGQATATITSLAEGRAARVNHVEGSDVVLLSPGQPAEVKDGEYFLKGQIAFARRYTDRRIRLAVMKGESTAAYGDLSLSSSGAVSLEIKGNHITGESSGEAHEARITLPVKFGAATVLINGKVVPSTRAGQVMTVQLPAGANLFTIQEHH